MRLSAEGLCAEAGTRPVLAGVSFTVATGELVAIVGPSGSGKSALLRALLGLLPFHPGLTGGRVIVDGEPVEPSRLRGRVVSKLYQDARGSLDPLSTVAASIRRAGGDPGACLQRAGLGDASPVATRYPHELSGGMAQRAALAVALAAASPVLVCDEPTTGLDAPVQREILAELRSLREHAVVLVTHDLELVDPACDRVYVLDGGRVVDEAPRPSSLRGSGRALWQATLALRRRRA
ncbi:MAG: ATP-binding cassette domain-containing protein [Deltaproteobacteria bacterium]|nr:ATP-binding cassette domain-containing protein [Deltaproteobacteria bacterium]